MISVVLCKVSQPSHQKRKSYDENFVTAKCACINDRATLTGRDLESLTANDRRQTQVVNFSNQEISR